MHATNETTQTATHPCLAGARRVWIALLALILASITGCADADPTGPADGEPTPPAVGQVLVSPADHELEVGQELQVQVQVLSTTGQPLTDRRINWTSTVATVATVDSTGTVRALAVGTARVRATVEGKVGEVHVQVTELEQPPEQVPPTLTAVEPASLPAGSPTTEITLRGTGFADDMVVFWYGVTRDATVVDAKEARVVLLASDLRNPGTGRLRVVKQGIGGAPLESNELELVIEPAPPVVATLELVAPARLMFTGETLFFVARALDADGNPIDGVDVEWSSVNPAVVEAGADGTVRAHAPGLSTVSARAGGKEASVQVRVTAAPAGGLLLTGHAPFSAGRALITLDPGVEGGWSTLLVPEGARQAVPSPDDSLIAFVLDTPEGGADLHVIGRNGTGLRRLTTNPGVDDQPAWSPDGQTLAFRSIRNGLTDVWTIRLDGTGLRNVTDLGDYRYGLLGAERPAYSPDGQWIAFAWGDRGVHPGRMSLAVIQPDGTDMRRVTQPSAYEDTEPSFSPDGQRLAFRRNGNGLTHRILTTDLDGNIDVYAWDLGSGRTPRWSPDGAWLAYVTTSPGLPDYGQVVLKPIGHADERRMGGAFDVAWR